jgi:hypothetical protein
MQSEVCKLHSARPLERSGPTFQPPVYVRRTSSLWPAISPRKPRVCLRKKNPKRHKRQTRGKQSVLTGVVCGYQSDEEMWRWGALLLIGLTSGCAVNAQPASPQLAPVKHAYTNISAKKGYEARLCTFYIEIVLTPPAVLAKR